MKGSGVRGSPNSMDLSCPQRQKSHCCTLPEFHLGAGMVSVSLRCFKQRRTPRVNSGRSRMTRPICTSWPKVPGLDSAHPSRPIFQCSPLPQAACGCRGGDKRNSPRWRCQTNSSKGSPDLIKAETSAIVSLKRVSWLPKWII